MPDGEQTILITFDVALSMLHSIKEVVDEDDELFNVNTRLLLSSTLLYAMGARNDMKQQIQNHGCQDCD